MLKEQTDKIKECRIKLLQLNHEIDECYCELDKLMADSVGSFEDSYVVYFDGETYVFMKVEKQFSCNQSGTIELHGPAIKLCGNPLDIDVSSQEDEDIDYGSYDETDCLSFNMRVLDGNRVENIRKITKEDMEYVIDYYHKAMKEVLL